MHTVKSTTKTITQATKAQAKAKTQTRKAKTNTCAATNSTMIQSKTCVDKGMGFQGIWLKGALTTFNSKLKGKRPVSEEFTKYIAPILQKAGGIVTNFFDFAIGDFNGTQLATMENLVCDVVPLEEDSKFGVIAVKLSNLPCGKPTSITACFTFSQCGSFTLAFNGGLLACAVSTTGIGQIVAPFIDAIEHVGIGFSINNKIVQQIEVYNYNSTEGTFAKSQTVVKGNLYFTLGISVADIIFPDSVKIGNKTLGELFEIKGRMDIIVDFGKTFSNLGNVISQARSGTKVNFMSLIKSFLNSGAETALAIKASFSFKLADLTKNFLPDLEIANASFDMLASMGGGYSGVSKGVYFRISTQITFIQSLYDGIKNTIGKLTAFFGYEMPTLNLIAKVEVGVAIQGDVTGLLLSGDLGDLGKNMTCLYRYSNDDLSCNGWSLNPFTIIKQGLEWVVKKAEKFFQQVGEEIRVAFEDFGKKIISNIVEPANRFFKGEGKLPSTCPSGMENSVGLCYPPCRSGFYGVITQCIMNCPDGFRNDGYFCAKPSPYGRGSGYVIWDEWKCNRDNPGNGCEKWGLMWYPRCRSGFYAAGCCICSPNCPSGYTDIGVSCAKQVYDRGVGKMPKCASDEDYIAGLCYKRKGANFDYKAQYLERKRQGLA